MTFDFFNQHNRKVLADYAQPDGKAIRLEVSAPDHWKIFLTINPDPSNMRARSAVGQFRETLPLLLNQLKRFAEYEIYPEYTLIGNVHYHVLLNIINHAEHPKAIRKLKELGNMKVEYIKNTVKVHTYCNKVIQPMIDLLKVSLPVRSIDRKTEL